MGHKESLDRSDYSNSKFCKKKIKKNKRRELNFFFFKVSVAEILYIGNQFRNQKRMKIEELIKNEENKEFAFSLLSIYDEKNEGFITFEEFSKICGVVTRGCFETNMECKKKKNFQKKMIIF